MAALAGWGVSARCVADEPALGRMLAALAPRGIAGLVGYFERNRYRQVALGAALHEAGVALVLDGAIANAAELRAKLAGRGFQFAGESAEELVLRGYQYWDKDVLKQLRGAFAFALWDARKDRLLLARDRFGEKPLYVHEKGDALHFASEAKALLAAGVPARLDPLALKQCISDRYVAGGRTLFAGVRKLQPGCYAVWQNGKLHEARYWTAPDRAPGRPGPSGPAVEGFLAALQEAIALRPADGLLLSGGLDSAVLLALAAARGGRPKTFAMGFEGDAASELPAAAQAAKHFGAEHHEIVVAPHELAAHIEYMIARRDAPLPRASDLALCRLAAETVPRVRTLLSGDGCDEVLGGYRRYTLAGRLAGLKESDADPGASALRRAMYADQTGSLPDELLERNDRAFGPAEARMPFLDHRLAEYVSGLPDAERVRGATTKWILREAAERVLPPPLRNRPKAGWRLDVGAWLRGDLREFTRDHLAGASCAVRRHCDGAALDRMLEQHMKANKDHSKTLWTLLNIEIWHRIYAPG